MNVLLPFNAQLPTFSVRPFETPCRIDQQQQQQHERHDSNIMCTIILEIKIHGTKTHSTTVTNVGTNSVVSADFLCHVQNLL